MKRCFKCESVKPLSEFYKHPMMADGRVNKCKECNKRDVKANRKSKIDYYRDYDRRRHTKEFLSPEKWEKRVRLMYDRTTKYREANPKKYKAHGMVGRAIRAGTLVPGRCEVCGYSDVHGHHDDYDKPLTVRWLCSEHHIAWHLENGEGANAHDN